MIVTFKHKGLKDFFNNGNSSKIQTNHIKKIRLLLANLNAATRVENMNLPGLDLHQLVGNKQGYWSVRVNGNWRLIFRFVESNAYDVDYIDYH